MKNIYYLLLCPIFFMFSCGNNTTDPKTDSVVAVNHDFFKEGVQKLRRNGFLKQYSEKALDSLTEVYRLDSLNGMKKLMVAAGDLLNIEISIDHGAPHEIYKSISDTIGAKYPDLKASELKHKYLPEFPGDKDTGWIVIDQKFGASWYSRKLYYFADWPVDNFIYRMYNTMLADVSDKTRLYLVEFFLENDTLERDDFMGNLDIDHMGLLRLTKQQADTLLSIPELAIDPQDEFSVYPTALVEEQLSKFEASGLLGPQDQKWFESIKTDIRMNSIYSQEDILDFVDTFFCTLMFDTLNDYNPYEDLITSMSMVSRGHFEPSGIADSQVGQTPVRSIRYKLNDQVYERDLQSQNNIMSPLIMEMVNESLAEQKAGGAFYSVLTRGDVVLAVYIEDSKIDQVTKSGFFKNIEKGPSTELQIIYGQAPPSF